MSIFPESLEPLYSALGKVVYAWAYVEHLIDSCVSIVYHSYDGKPIAFRQEIPRSLSNKINLLKKAFQTIDKLAKYQIEGLTLINRVSSLSDQRHNMIHSIFHTTSDHFSYTFSKYKYEKEGHTIREFAFTLDEYLQLGNKLLGLADELVSFAFSLHYPGQPKPW